MLQLSLVLLTLLLGWLTTEQILITNDHQYLLMAAHKMEKTEQTVRYLQLKCIQFSLLNQFTNIFSLTSMYNVSDFIHNHIEKLSLTDYSYIFDDGH